MCVNISLKFIWWLKKFDTLQVKNTFQSRRVCNELCDKKKGGGGIILIRSYSDNEKIMHNYLEEGNGFIQHFQGHRFIQLQKQNKYITKYI